MEPPAKWKYRIFQWHSVDEKGKEWEITGDVDIRGFAAIIILLIVLVLLAQL